MNQPKVSSEQFGELIASALGTGPSRSTLASQRARILSQAERFERRRVLPWVSAFSLAAAAALVVLFFALRQPAPRELRASFAGANVPESGFVEARSNTEQAIDFSDGSSVVLSPSARAELSRLDKQRADLRLEHGHILASIQKHTGRTWTIAVGPYAVRVVGTRFSVDWDRHSHVLKVEVREGKVRVFGGDLPGDGVSLDAGARLERRYAKVADAEQKQEPANTGDVKLGGTDRPLPGSSREPMVRAEPSVNVGSSAPSEAKWLALANRGKYREALSLANKQGFDSLLSELPENDLLVLANTARFSGDGAQARKALLRLRERFPGRRSAELAALYLARVAEDLQKQPAETARWLRTFLQESPRGDLAAGARVNLMSILLRSGDQAGARAVAQDYLRYHPNGPNASQARALIE